MKRYWVLTLFFILVSLAGCYSTGKLFSSPNLNALQLNKTTLNEIILENGQPNSILIFVSNGQEIEQAEYTYYTAAGFAMGQGPVGRKAQYFFSDGALTGYVYTSSIPGDSTDFDIDKSKQIIVGSSTRKDIEAILGPPTGELVYPMIESKDGTELCYYHVGSAGVFASGGLVSKKLGILIDSKGVVQNVNQPE